MQKGIFISINIIAVILLVLGSLTNVVGFQVAQSSNQKMMKDDIDLKKLLFQTILDIANNKEIQSIIQKFEIKGSPISFQQLLGRLQKDIIGAIEKNDALNGRLKQLSDLPCDCEKDYTTRWSFPILCILLFPLFIFSFMLSFKFHIDEPINILMFIGSTYLNCFWTHW
jgi:hypothetical protein